MKSLLLLLLILFPLRVAAQTQCGYAEALRFPVDPQRFEIVQDYAAASPRHQGRYHTGEDWYARSDGDGTGYGAFVSAVGNGRVTFSSPNGWGRDGGVIIIEHTFRDGTVVYSQYGHVTDATGIQFPSVFTCVREGDIIAAIGDARPAPHLHFEIRTRQPDVPGAGYVWENPAALGLLRPSKFVLNRGARFVDGFAWAANLSDETGPTSPPLLLGDNGSNGLLVLDSNRVLGLSYDGRVLWRVNLDRAAVGLLPAPSGISAAGVIVYSDGGVQVITVEGERGASWSLGFEIAELWTVGSEAFALTHGGALVRLNTARQGIAWRVENVGSPVQIAAAGDLVGVMTQANEMLTINGGMAIQRAMLREPGALLAQGDRLIAYTQGGLWTVDAGGVWALIDAEAPAGGFSAAVAALSDGSLALFDGETLHGRGWQTPIGAVNGRAMLRAYEDVMLLISTDGVIVAVRAADGALCNRARVWGDRRARAWAVLGGDNVLRIHIADQVIGFNWRAFLMACG